MLPNIEHQKTPVNLFCLLIVAVMVVVYGMLRMGFNDNSWLDLLSTAGLSICFLLLPDFLARLSFLRTDKVSVTLITLDVWFSLVLLSFVPFIGVVFPYLCVLGALFLLVDFIKQSKGSVGNLSAFIGGILFAFYFASALWGGKCHNPLYFEKIALGEAHIDLMYHATISNLLKTHGFATTGLDGNIYLPYHWASHFVAGRFSDLLNITTVKLYNFSLYVVLIPLFFKSLFLLVADLRNFHTHPQPRKGSLPHSPTHLNGKDSGVVAGSDFIATFFIFALLIPLIMRVSGALYGESTLMAAILSLLIFSLLFKYLQAKRSVELIVASLLIGILGLFKISFGFILVGVYAWLFLRRGWYKSLSKCLLFALTAAMFVLIYSYNNETGGSANGGFSPRHTLNSLLGLFSIKTCLYYSLCAIPFLFLLFKKLKYKKPSETILIELLFVIPTLGFIPAALINLHHNSVYFTGYQIYFGAAMVLVLLPEMMHDFRQLPVLNFQNLTKVNRSLLFSSALKIGIGLAIVSTIWFGVSAFLKQLPVPLRQNLTIRKALLNIDDLSQTNRATLIHKPQQNISQNPHYQVIQTLQKLNDKPRSFKRKACLWIPPDNRLYWDMQHYREYGSPFVATSLSGISMINGRPDKDFSRYSYYQYSIDDTHYSNIDIIKKKASEKGFSILLELNEKGVLVVHDL